MFGLFKKKGKIEIQLQKYNYTPGEMVEGTLILRPKKLLEGRELDIRLVAKQKTTSGFGNNKRTTYETIYDFKYPLEKEKNYQPGEVVEHKFQIKIPLQQETSVPESTMGTVLKVAKMVSGTRTRIKWYVKGRLDIKGFDIRKKVQINVT